jgi:fructosamine-3-kinase
MINSVLRLTFDRPPFKAVLKLNGPTVSFAPEARALRYLTGQTRFPSPRVFLEDHSGRIISGSFLLMENLPGINLQQASLSPAELDRLDRSLAKILLELHGHTRSAFGEPDQQGSADWTDIFLSRLFEVRQKPEVSLKLSPNVLKDVDRAIQRCGPGLKIRRKPALIHGDVWAGNIIVNDDGRGWTITGLVDPGLQFGDEEAELAYLECFDTDRRSFFEVYAGQTPLRPGYEVRRLFYWLHTALVHVWLFNDAGYPDYMARVAGAILAKT